MKFLGIVKIFFAALQLTAAKPDVLRLVADKLFFCTPHYGLETVDPWRQQLARNSRSLDT